MFFMLCVILGVVGAFLYFIGMLIGMEPVEKIGEGIIVGTLIGMIPQILILALEIEGMLAAIISFFIILFLIFFQREGGPPVIYTIAIFAIVVGYLFTGPYSGFVKTYTSQITEPLGEAISVATASMGEVWLMMTDPQEYIKQQEIKAVRTVDNATLYPKGVELKQVKLMPDYIPADQNFYVQVYALNEGKMNANLIVRAACSNKLCCLGETCGISSDTIQIYPSSEKPVLLKPHEAVNIIMPSPFTATAFKKTDIGKTADVNVSLHYAHATSSMLMVTVMNSKEVTRIMTDPASGESLFKSKVSVGRNSPGMLALTVGYQPLFAGTENSGKSVLMVSIVNKRPKGQVIIDKGTEIRIKMPNSIGSGLQCGAGEELACNPSGGGGDYEEVLCSITRDDGLFPIKPTKYFPITCTFDVIGEESVPIRVSDIITAELNGYTFEISEKKGARIAFSYKPLDNLTSTTSGDSGGGATTSTILTPTTVPVVDDSLLVVQSIP